MHIRACQLDAETGDARARMAAVRWLTADSASDGADVVVFPELALTGYGAGDDIRDLAETIDGPAVTELQRLADEHAVTVITGLALRQEGGVVNAALVARPRQKPIVYAKQHLYGDYEKALFTPGRSPSDLFEIAGMKAAVLVCFDVEFPERVRELAIAGAEIVFVPTALPASEGARFVAEKIVPVRAFENQIFIVYVDHVGADARFAYQGLSCIAAPDGSRITSAPDDGFAILSASIDRSDYAESLLQNPYLVELAAHVERRATPQPGRKEAAASGD
ncbi:hydrolase [Aureimonas sp. SA4125]|uniref:nitrilase-related carbon-nitrogen hydrolase n=1 Tax=Aureimonas sp. SA4125 TaxID=2826993 RepID=UPI001CC58B70|nr:nitrilase-related carbon-nitrogen hydrolase [Aureimonas sp. SA4125]BDA85677.1 hydrolase [Aureimonas sp. SA4125]